MTDKKPELSAAMKSKVEPKVFKKNPIIGTKFTIAISSAKGGVGKSSFATNLSLALKNIVEAIKPGCNSIQNKIEVGQCEYQTQKALCKNQM